MSIATLSFKHTNLHSPKYTRLDRRRWWRQWPFDGCKQPIYSSPCDVIIHYVMEKCTMLKWYGIEFFLFYSSTALGEVRDLTLILDCRHFQLDFNRDSTFYILILSVFVIPTIQRFAFTCPINNIPGRVMGSFRMHLFIEKNRKHMIDAQSALTYSYFSLSFRFKVRCESGLSNIKA